VRDGTACMKAPSEETYGESTQETKSWKVHVIQWVISLSLTVRVYSSFVWLLLPPKSAKSREILRKFELTAVQGHPRSSILVPIENAYATSYWTYLI